MKAKLITVILALLFVHAGRAQNLIDLTYGTGAGSFELGTFAPTSTDSMRLSVGSTAITGWTVGNGMFGTGTGIDWLRSPSYNPADGTKTVDLQGANASSISTQFPTIIGATYQLVLSVSTVGASNWGFWSAGDQTNDKFGPVPNGSNPASQTFVDSTFTFTATSTTTTLIIGSYGSGGYGPAIDNVRVTAVPEPSSVFSIIAGSLIVCSSRWRTNRRRTKRSS